MIINNRKNMSWFQLFFFGLMIILFCSFVLALPRISIPLFLSYILSLALSPMVNFLMSLKLSRTMSIVLIFIIMATLIGIPLVKIIPTVSTESKNLENFIPRIEAYTMEQFDSFSEFIKLKTGHKIEETYIHQTLEEIQTWTTGFVVKIPNYLAVLIEWIFLIPFFTFFIIRDSDLFKKTFLSFTPNLIFERFYYVMHVFNRQLGNYFFAKLVEAVIVGGIISLGLLIMDIKYAVILGFVAGITNIVPYVGPMLGAIPAICFVMLEYGLTSPVMMGTVILYAVANVVDIFFVFPFLVSKIVNLHPMIVALGVIVGSHYMGITGMVISIPVVAAIKLIITEIYNEIYTERSQ